ncbi:hypothetical protein [Enterococcus rivorum]
MKLYRVSTIGDESYSDKMMFVLAESKDSLATQIKELIRETY